jgi:hypothetical protein
VTGKIPAEHKEILQRHGVNVSKLIRNAVEEAVHRIQEEEMRKALADASQILQKISDQEIIDNIRSSRDQR